jgi:hypothetical protein
VASKKDLVEAHAFSRRRLVTAFVSGAPGGREVEPARPGRIIIGGLALTVLLIAGAAVAGVFTKKTPDDWAKVGLYVSKEGGRYIITEDSDPAVVRPIANITSAKLILGADAKATVVSEEAIDKETPGEEIGILGAPETPPSIEQLIPAGWTACTTNASGVRVLVHEKPDVTATPTGGATVVRVGQGKTAGYYLLAQSAATSSDIPSVYSYKLPENGSARDNMLRNLQLPTATATEVPESFLTLFPTGGSLEMKSMGISGMGEPVTYSRPESGIPSGARVGDMLRLPGGQSLILTKEGPADLDEFAAAVYPVMQGRAQVTQMRGDLGQATVPAPYLGAHWPASMLRPVLGEVCAQLNPAAGSRPRVDLVQAPGALASATEVPAQAKSVLVQPGRGAMVLGGDWADSDRGSPYLIDATGRTYPLVGGSAKTQLGYGSYDAPVVPDSWLELFERGVSLSQSAALCPPVVSKDETCE